MTDIVITPASVIAGADASIDFGVAGQAITAGQVVYLETATNKLKLADNNATDIEVRTARGIALNGAADGQPIGVIPFWASDNRRNAAAKRRLLSERHAGRHLCGRRSRAGRISDTARHGQDRDFARRAYLHDRRRRSDRWLTVLPSRFATRTNSPGSCVSSRRKR